VPLRDLERFFAASGRQYLIAVCSQSVADRLQHGGLVIHHQDGRTAGAHRYAYATRIPGQSETKRGRPARGNY